MRTKPTTRALIVAMVVAAVASLVSCSPNRNNAATRQYQAFITRYNIYYNGDTHYKETLAEQQKKFEDDYSRLLYVDPAEAQYDPKQPRVSSAFDRSIEKAQKAIQLRSIKKRPAKKSGKANDPKYKEWMKRDEYNPFLHNAWMMMGRSQYQNGDFLGSAATFFYISKHFTWLPATVTEAKLWEASSYCAMDWLFEAEVILTRIKPDQLTNKTLRYLYYSTYGDYYSRMKDYERAVPMIEQAIKLSKQPQKTRLWFLLGQLYTHTGDKQAAYKAFKKAGSASSASYRTKFNARIRQSEVYTGDDIEPEVRALRRMTRYDRNKEYLDQVYYAIGNLYLSRGDTLHAIENYVLAAEKSTRNGIDKAISQVTLGGLYYDLGQYAKAQPCYAEAIPLLPEDYPDYKRLKLRSDVLDELALYSQNVELQDSLLRLSYMTPEEQKAVAMKLIEELRKKEKEEADEARRQEFLAEQAAKGDAFQNSNNSAANPMQFNIGGDDSWYFYNTAAKTAGKTEFQKRWGSRKLEDDWRRRNKTSFNVADFDDHADSDDQTKEADAPDTAQADAADGPGKEAAAGNAEAEHADDPHYPEYYLKQIPSTDEERQTANEVIQEGLYNMGVILKDKLEDFPAAEHEFDRLLSRYPDNIYRLDVYYNLYLMYMRQGDVARAEHYRQLIMSEFADSKYAVAMRDPNYLDNLRNMDAVQQELYDLAYQKYLDNENAGVHALYEQMSEQYPLSKIMPKFMFLHALAYVTEKDNEGFRTTLRDLLDRYPDTDLTPYVSAYLKGIAQGREVNSGAANMRGMLWDTRLSADSTAVATEGAIEFDLDPEKQQLFILLYPTDVVSPNELLYEIARHNFASFVVKDFDLEQMNFGRLGLLIVKGFDNVYDINHYRRVMASDASLRLPPEVRPVVISADNFDLLLKEGRSFEEYFEYVRDKTYRDTEESVLPPEFFGPSEGIPDESRNSENSEISDNSDNSESSESSESSENSDNSEISESSESSEISEQPQQQPPQPEAKPAEPAPAPAPQPVPENPAPKPQKPTPKPQQPAPKPQKPALPDYPVGSEGDDPLLD